MNSTYQVGPARGSKNLISYALFLREYVRNPRRTASVCPSSPVLSRRLAECIDFDRARTIVDLGAGTGAVTEAILNRLPRNARLFAVDNNSSFVEHLSQTFPDRRMFAVHAQAVELAPTLASMGVNQVDVIVSSLGLTSMTPEVRDPIVRHLASCLKPDGVLIQYQYLTSRWSWLTVNGKSHFPFEAEELLKTSFGTVNAQDVMLNIPPARIFVCHDPIEN